MSEIASNFRISLDLFELVTFGTNYGLQAANETVTRCPKVALRYFGPFPAKRLLEVIDTLVFFNANLAFQNTPDAMVQRICIRRFWWPLCAGNEATFCIHSWVACAESCRNVQRLRTFQNIFTWYSAFILMSRSINTSGERPSAVMRPTPPPWPALEFWWPNEGVHFQLTPLASKHERIILFVYKLLDNEYFLIGENQIRQFTTFGQWKQLLSSFGVYFLSVAL